MGRTRIVRWLRVILPLAALVILSMLFLLARRPDPEAAIPYAEGSSEELGRAPGMSGAIYSTVARDGATITLTAARVVPSAQGGGSARDLTLDWQSRKGGTARVSAAEGTQEGAVITLAGGVRGTLSGGWAFDAPRLVADSGQGVLTAPDGVRAEAPFGPVEAGGMVLTPGAGGAGVLELNRGVRLLYRP